jgi:hypothetical protein
MKFTTAFAAAAIVVLTLPAAAGSLGADSKSPDWATASAADKDAYVSAYKITKEGVTKAKIMTCMEKYAIKPALSQSQLSGVVSLCETIAALPQ